MDSCSTSSRVSEESERSWECVSEKKKPSMLNGTESKKSSGPISPDGVEWSTDDDEPALPRMRTRDERRPLLNVESTQHVLQERKTPVVPSRHSSRPATALPENEPLPVPAPAVEHSRGSRFANQSRKAEQHVISEKKKLNDSCATSSLVSESLEDNNVILPAKENPPKGKGPDWRKPGDHQSGDSVHRLSSNGDSAAPPARSRSKQPQSSNSPATQRAPQKNNARVTLLQPSIPTAKTLPQKSIDPVLPCIVDTSPVMMSPQKVKVPATAAEYLEMKYLLRDLAMKACKYDPNINRFSIIFEDDRYSHIDDRSKFKALMGYVIPFYSNNTCDRDQQRYYDEVSRLYTYNYGARGAAQLKEVQNQLNQFATPKEKEDYLFKVLDNLLWKLTPNQRHGLREKFECLYGNSTLADDTNWMFFDTIIRSHEPDNDKQRELIKEIMSASKETRLEKRYHLQNIIHGHLTPDERENLKRVCKKRHDNFSYSRMPLFHLIIREKNIDAMVDYLHTLTSYLPRKYYYRFLTVRCIDKESDYKLRGDTAFFTMVQWGSIEMLRLFLRSILETDCLSFREKSKLLIACRLTDRTTAFHMILAGGDYDRAKAFVYTIIDYFNNQVDYFNAHPKRPSKMVLVNGFASLNSMYALCCHLLLAYQKDPRRGVGFLNGYSRAVDHGHKNSQKNSPI